MLDLVLASMGVLNFSSCLGSLIIVTNLGLFVVL